ncbi:MAG: hypothetical protein FWH15_08800 [Betaproteobacteria bacterium]|nr:hypothetical protein [Betaproteobacteria bacterium]
MIASLLDRFIDIVPLVIVLLVFYALIYFGMRSAGGSKSPTARLLERQIDLIERQNDLIERHVKAAERIATALEKNETEG